MALADKMRQLKSLLGAEREKRQILAGLQDQIDAAHALIASVPDVQGRLDGIHGEIDAHMGRARDAAAVHLRSAQAEGDSIRKDATAEAAKIIADARAVAAEEAEEHAALAADRKAEISRLDAEITALLQEHARITQIIAEAKAKFS